jgi:hypothetical protein
MGKAFFLMFRLFFLIGFIAAVSGCSGAADRLQSGRVMGWFGLEGRWAGPVTAKADGCGPTATGQMSVEQTKFAFDPFQGTTIINGSVSDDGHLDGVLSRPGNGQQVVSISFSGSAVKHDGGEQTIDGVLTSGRCSWSVSLKPA